MPITENQYVIEDPNKKDLNSLIQYLTGKRKEIPFVALRFTDLFGATQEHISPTSHLVADEGAALRQGLEFDGSSIRKWQKGHKSDMLWVPDPTTAVMDAFAHP